MSTMNYYLLSPADKIRFRFVDDLSYAGPAGPCPPAKQEKKTKKRMRFGSKSSSPPERVPSPIPQGPFVLSEHFSYLAAEPQRNKALLLETLCRLQNALPQMSEDRLKQARADMIYLRAVLDGEEASVAQTRAAIVWASSSK